MIKALAVIFAMIASYLLSRTLVPCLASLLLPGEVANASKPASGLARWHHAFEAFLDQIARVQHKILERLLRRWWLAPLAVVAVAGAQ
jgi:multidrug efflux pump subunit AcrB